MGIGAAVMPGVTVGDWATVGSRRCGREGRSGWRDRCRRPGAPAQGDAVKRIYLSPPHMGGDELELVRGAFESNWIAPLGPHVDAFEREFAEAVGVRHAAALSSGTAALHLALQMLGVEARRRGARARR